MRTVLNTSSTARLSSCPLNPCKDNVKADAEINRRLNRDTRVMVKVNSEHMSTPLVEVSRRLMFSPSVCESVNTSAHYENPYCVSRFPLSAFANRWANNMHAHRRRSGWITRTPSSHALM